MITSNIYSVKKALDQKLVEIDVGVMKARDEMMARLIQLSQEEIKGKRPKGQKATTGEPPMNRTGNLRRSITGKKAQEGFASYSAVVGPTTVYARAVELGGAPTWINGEHFPYMKPALQKFQREAMAIVRKYLGQEGKHMAEFLPPVIFEIQANATKAIAQMQTVNGELDKMEVKAIKAGGSLDVMTKASKFAGTALLGIAGVLGTVATVSIKAALSVQESQAKLSTAVKNTGVSFQTFIPYMNQAQESMAKFGFGAEDTNQALASMTAATRNPSVAIANLGVVADLAAFKNESLAAAADTVSRATMGQARGLADLGLAIGKTIPKGADLATITKMVEDRVKGAAAAAAKADPWKVLTTQFQVMTEQLGTALLPAFERITDWITNKGIPGLKSLGKWISDNKGLFETFGLILATIWVVPKVAAFIKAITLIKDSFVALRTVLAGVDIAEALATGGASAIAGLAAIAAAAAVYLNYKNLLAPSTSNAGGTPAPLPTKAAGSLLPTKVTKLLTPKALPSNINSGLKPNIITSPTKTKATSSKGLTAAQQKAGIMGGGGALTLTITTSNGAVVNSITGSAGHTKVVVKKGK